MAADSFGSRRDPPVLVSVIASLLPTNLVASIVPASRAMRVDPVIALRSD